MEGAGVGLSTRDICKTISISKMKQARPAREWEEHK